MDKFERSDTEPFLQSEEFESFLRDDSLLPHLGSHAFSELLHSPAHSEGLGQKIESCDLSATSKVSNLLDSKQIFAPQWHNLTNDPANQKVIKLEDGTLIIDPMNDAIYEDDNLALDQDGGDELDLCVAMQAPSKEFQPSLSIQPWSGIHNFDISLDTSKYPSTKWGYSDISNKLYVMPQVAVPIEVSVNEWMNAYINITPVYKKSQHHSEAVERCYNHKKTDEEMNVPTAEHIIQVENEDASYKFIGGRHCVEIPLGSPPPGESKKLLFVKCGCWNTCIGGPNRRQILIVFTLISCGREIGRQVLEVKSCQCPIRDMGIEESKREKPPVKNKKPKVKLSDGKVVIATKGTKRSKLENEASYEQIIVPSDIASDVKRYVNLLMAERYVKQKTGYKLPFSDSS